MPDVEADAVLMGVLLEGCKDKKEKVRIDADMDTMLRTSCNQSYLNC